MTNDCSCDECKKMCDRPCWGTPAEIQAIIDAGLGHRLMLDWGEQSHDLILCPGLKDHESNFAPEWPISAAGCTFRNDDGLCELHDLGLKPAEGKSAIHGNNRNAIHRHHLIGRLWLGNPEGEKLIDRWFKNLFAK